MEDSKIGMLQIMLLYPIHQTIGQMAGIFYNSTNRNKIYSLWGTIQITSSLVITYFLIAPGTYFVPGLNLGALGVALKTVSLQFIGTNILTYINCKFLNLRFSEHLIHQLIVLPSCFLIGMLAKWIAETITSSNLNFLLVSSFVYVATILIVAITFPRLIGFKDKFIFSKRSYLSGPSKKS